MICFYALELKNKLQYDDSLDCFGIHGVGSGFGVLALSFLIRPSWMADAVSKVSSWTALDQFLLQLKGMGVTALLAGSVTFLLCLAIEKTVGFRLGREQELAGLDHSQHSESGYGLINLN